MSIRVSRSPASWPGGASCSNTGTRYRSTQTVPVACRTASRRWGETRCSLSRIMSRDDQKDSSTATPNPG
jgi:hypothetical protein